MSTPTVGHAISTGAIFGAVLGTLSGDRKRSQGGALWGALLGVPVALLLFRRSEAAQEAQSEAISGWGADVGYGENRYPCIRRGARGDAVEYLHLFLAGNGFAVIRNGKNQPWPDFSGDTEAQVRAFQRSKGLGVDGVVGPNTWKKLTPRAKGLPCGSTARAPAAPQTPAPQTPFAPQTAAPIPRTAAPPAGVDTGTFFQKNKTPIIIGSSLLVVTLLSLVAFKAAS